MKRFLFRTLCATALSMLVLQSAPAVTISTVPIGNPGNAADMQFNGTFGSVGYNYRIGTTEVTNAQYVEFLNGVAASNPYGLYSTLMTSDSRGGIVRSGSAGSYTYAVKPDEGFGGSDYTYADKPVVFVSWYDAIRFVNWLHNGQGNGDTETGAYTLEGGTPIPSNGNSITRNSGARWFLPSEDEWYKAAYYDASASVYYNYPTGSDTAPGNNPPSADTGDSANFRDGSGYANVYPSHPMTDAGAYTLSGSPYNTFDQGGNVFEWNETRVGSSERGMRGGSWDGGSVNLHVEFRTSFGPSSQFSVVGFRVASIPEPANITLWLGSMLTLALWRGRMK